jgi:CxxC motif-containing protein (DUF1111 family)
VNDRQLIFAHACDRENSGKPDAGKRQVRFDEGGGGQETGPSATRPFPAMQTGPNAVAALDQVDFFPFSDFLLHDMGSLNDGISQSGAKGHEMRTAPLWGARIRTSFLHDGRAKTIPAAILAHDGQGLAARNLFANLSARERAQLVEFINSL